MSIVDKLIEPFRKDLSSSRSMGSVIRNYVSGPKFDPYKQFTGITYKAISKIAQSLSTYEPQVKRRNGEMIENHPLYTLLDKPNEKQTGSDFLHLYALHMEIYGEAFFYKVKGEDTKKIRRLYLLPPDKMEIVAPNGILLGYKLNKTNGQQVPFEPEEIYHDKTPNPFNEWRGLSVLEKSAVYIDTEINTANFTLSYIKNNASPSGIVSLPNMSPEAFEKFTLKWREGYEGPHNAGKTAFIRGEGTDFKAVGATLKDIDQKITREMAEDDVLMMLEVPRALLGKSGDKGLGRADIDSLYYIFNKEKIDPIMKRLDKIFTSVLPEIAPRDSDRGYIVGHISPVPQDKEFEHKQLKELTNIVITPNEARERLGLDPIPGGDELVKDNRVPIETKQTKKLTIKKVIKQTEEETSEEFRKRLIETNSVYEKKIKSEISDFATEQEKTVIDKISATKKVYEEWLPEAKVASEELAVLLTPVMIELMEEQSKDVAHFITGEPLVIDEVKRKVVESNILRIAGVYNDTTIKDLESTLNAGLANGESLPKLKKRVEQVYSDAKGYRAERIARTESLRTSNRTVELVYQENGYTKVKWHTNPDACEFCQTFDGVTREIGGKYGEIGSTVTGVDGGKMQITYDVLDVPPLHPNCTCSLDPVS